MAQSEGRLKKELAEVGKDDTSGVKANPVVDGNLRHLLGTIKGPEGTVYDGGVFEIDIVIPASYPFQPPQMKFLTKIWHPNISSQTGAICLVCWNPSMKPEGFQGSEAGNCSLWEFPRVFLFNQDILKDQWSPALTIKTALLSLQALLCSPEPGDPQDAQVAKMYKSSRAEFDRTARFWTESFAKPTSKEDAINRVCEMGFPREQAQKALEEAKWDENAAVAALLNAL
jgi:ubiquitin-conjugating enzyme (huntingtin interacting protein 2)